MEHKNKAGTERPHNISVKPGRLGWYQRGAYLASNLFLKRFTEAYAIEVIKDLGKFDEMKDDLKSFSRLMDVRAY